MKALRFATGVRGYKVCGQRLGLQQAAFNPPASLLYRKLASLGFI